MRKIKLCATFAGSFFAAAAVTGICVWLLCGQGPGIIAVLFYFKVITSALVLYVVDDVKAGEYCYYRNLSMGRVRLWTAVCAADMLLFFVLIFGVWRIFL